MSHNLQRLGKLLVKPPTWDRSAPAAPPGADKSGKCTLRAIVFRVTRQTEQPASTLPASPKPATARLTSSFYVFGPTAFRRPAQLQPGCRLILRSCVVWPALRADAFLASLRNPGGAGPQCASGSWEAFGDRLQERSTRVLLRRQERIGPDDT
jgi:hypothetical protein